MNPFHRPARISGQPLVLLTSDLTANQVADLLGVTVNNLRQQVHRGNFPKADGTAKAGSSVPWSASTVYAEMIRREVLPLEAVPAPLLREVAAKADLDLAPFRLESVAVITNSAYGSGLTRGVWLRYAARGLGMPLLVHYAEGMGVPVDPSRLEGGRPVAILSVEPQWTIEEGLVVRVIQWHEGMSYGEADYGPTWFHDEHTNTLDVARLLDSALPYWPFFERTTSVPVDRRNGRPIPIHAPSHSDWSDDVLVAMTPALTSPTEDLVELRTQLENHARQHLLEASADDLAEIERLEEEGWTTTSWDLDPDSPAHLYVVASPAGEAESLRRERYAIEGTPRTLYDTAMRTPTGDGAAARTIASAIGTLLGHPVTEPLPAPAGSALAEFASRLEVVEPERATLLHLALSDLGEETEGVVYVRDSLSGTIGVQRTERGGRRTMTLLPPTSWSESMGAVAGFDLTILEFPMALDVAGHAYPFPENSTGGYSLGYGGSGPHRTMEAIVDLLDLELPGSLQLTLPFFTEEYPSRPSVAEVRQLLTEHAF